jgi:AraC-like DNA-binding protein
VYAIAQSTGYDSEASLSKAFKRAFGQSPGEYRRERASSPIRIANVSAAESAGQAVTAAKNGWGWPVSA